jgi:cytochrome c oxidase subunit 3
VTDLRPSSHPRREPSFPQTSPAQLAMYVGMASMTVIFLASLAGYFVTRAQNKVWRTADMPNLPAGLLVSSAVLIALSLTLHHAEKSILQNLYDRLKHSLSIAVALCAAFLLVQIQNWRTVAHASLGLEEKSLYQFTFYMLTALHAAHVLLGSIPLVWVLMRAQKHEYSSSNFEGVRLTKQYWDFLLVVWVVLLTALHFGS